MTRRPYIYVRPYAWKTPDGTETRGVALMHGLRIRAHMTPAEARAIADKIHDTAERIETEAERQRSITHIDRPTHTQTSANGTEEPPLPTTPAEQE